MKILINVFVPAISEGYDILVPDFLSIVELTRLISRAVEEASNRKYISSGSEFLCLREKSILMRQDALPETYGIKNGEKLLLI